MLPGILCTALCVYIPGWRVNCICALPVLHHSFLFQRVWAGHRHPGTCTINRSELIALTMRTWHELCRLACL